VTLVATLAAATFPTKLLELRFEIAEPLETIKRPWTVRPVKVPTEVMLGWEGLLTTPATLAAATFPTKLLELRFEIAEPLETIKRPWTVRPVKVPTEVMLGWEGLVTTPATLAVATFPAKLLELRFEIPEPSPMYSEARTVERFETPKTFRVAEPKTVAEFTYKVETFRVSVILAEPKTYRLEPTGGALRVPMDTPFW
jgi:hypothetical protein